MYLGHPIDRRHLSEAVGTAAIAPAWLHGPRSAAFCLSTADFDGATKYLGDSVEAGRQLEIKELMAFGLAHLANTLIYLTRFDEAWETAQNCLRVSREIGDGRMCRPWRSRSLTIICGRAGGRSSRRKKASASLPRSACHGRGVRQS
jgi:hypothetical protein